MTTLFKIHWTNVGHWSPETFETMDEAIEYGRSKGPEFTVHREVKNDPRASLDYSVIVAGWQVFRGLKYYS